MCSDGPLLLINDLRRHHEALQPQLAARLRDVLESGWYILGSQTAAFEAAFAAYCGVAECIGTGNGTDALEIALRVIGAGPGGEVITVANAGGYSTAAILCTGAAPHYVDIEPDSMLMDLDRVAAGITPRTKAIIATHLYGLMVDMEALLAIADAAGVPVIEDCAQAHGARRDRKLAGSWGRLGCFSFYPTKNLGALGDGGAVVTSDREIAERVRALRQYGWVRKYECGPGSGRNSRLDEIQAAVLTAKLPYLDAWNNRRREIAALYSKILEESGVRPPAPAGESDVAHLYVIRTRHRDRIREELKARGIASDVHYPIPDHRQECYRSELWAQCALPVTEACCGEILTLPCFPEMRDDEVARVADAVRAAA